MWTVTYYRLVDYRLQPGVFCGRYHSRTCAEVMQRAMVRRYDCANWQVEVTYGN